MTVSWTPSETAKRFPCNSNVPRTEEGGDAYRVLVGKSDGKRPLERPRLRWKDKMDLRNVGWEAWAGTIWLTTGTRGRLL